jgi:hypothetical protein
MTETVVVNLRKEKCDVKICRNPKGQVPPAPAVGCFGNPFAVEKYGREKCIEMYRDYFYKKIEDDPAFKEAVLTLKGKRLGCFCKPQKCHGDVIKEWLDKSESSLH